MKNFFLTLFDKFTPDDVEIEQKALLKNTHLLDHVDRKTFNAIANASHLIAYRAGALIMKEGEPGESLFIIQQGAARVFTTNERGEEIVIARLEEGTYFGEQALLEEGSGKRNASVKAITNLSVLEISRANIADILRANTQLKQTLETIGKKQLVEKIFNQLDLFRSVDRATLLSFENKVMHFHDQEIIFVKGDISHYAYFIISGNVEITLDKTEATAPIILEPTQFFGKLGLVRKTHSGNAKAIGAVKLLAIKEDVFKKIYENTPQLRAFIGAMQQVYKIPHRGIVNLYQGLFLDMPTISANFKLEDGREVVTSRVMGQNIFTIATINTNNPTKIYIEKLDIIRELLICNDKIVGATSYGVWDNLGYVCELILDNTTLTTEQIQEFRNTGTLTPLSTEETKEMLCYCMRVKRSTIDEAIREGITNLDTITLKTGAGSVCGGCRPDILSIMGRYAWTPVYIDRIIKLHSDIRSYQLKPYDSSTRIPSYIPGQHVTISALIEPHWVERTYTLTSVSGRSDYYEITVKREEMGYFSRWLFNNDNSEPLLRISEPQGDFTFDLAVSAPAIYFAEEIGILPAVAFTRTLIQYSSRRQLHIDYSAPTLSQLTFAEEFLMVAEQYSNFTLRTRATDMEGHLSTTEINHLLQSFPNAEFFVCGSKTFITEMKALLRSFHIPLSHIKIEEFTSAGGPLPHPTSP